VKLSNKFEAVAMSVPPGVAKIKKKENRKVLDNDDNSNRKSNIKKFLLLGSSHGRGLCEHLHSVLGDEYMVKMLIFMFLPPVCAGQG
jgi:hypothetical protein